MYVCIEKKGEDDGAYSKKWWLRFGMVRERSGRPMDKLGKISVLNSSLLLSLALLAPRATSLHCSRLFVRMWVSLSHTPSRYVSPNGTRDTDDRHKNPCLNKVGQRLYSICISNIFCKRKNCTTMCIS